MAQSPNLRVLVDGDTSRVYRQGDRVTGRVFLVLEKGEFIKELKINFVGACITKTTRPVYVTGKNSEPCLSKRNFEEQVRLFNIQKSLVVSASLSASKHSWTFEFAFPEHTEARFSKWAHGTKYHKDAHPLPPSFSAYTNMPGGQAMVSYYVQARLTARGSSETHKATQHLSYQPPTSSDATRDAKVISRVLYNQTWKPIKESKKTVDKVFTKVSRKPKHEFKYPRIVPTLHYPEKVAPGQHIPLKISISNASVGEQPEVTIESLSVSIGTYTTSMCGNPWTQPEDSVSKHVTCISKHNIDTPLAFDSPTRLTSNFRLVDDSECVPTFKTYTITRRYSMVIAVGLKIAGETNQRFTVRSTNALEILPRIPQDDQTSRGGLADEVDGDVDPLPLYRAREHSMELAPDYETLYSLSPTPSRSMTFDYFGDGMSTPPSSGASTADTAPTTPESETGDPIATKSRDVAQENGLSSNDHARIQSEDQDVA